jgi:hypothetical protein
VILVVVTHVEYKNDKEAVEIAVYPEYGCNWERECGSSTQREDFLVVVRR